MKIKTTKVMRIILTVIFSLIFLFCLYKVGSYLLVTARAKADKEETKKYRPDISINAENDDIVSNTTTSETVFDDETKISTPQDTITDNENRDFTFPGLEELYKINSDLVGWIYVPDTNIDYPVFQADDNYYYLYKSYRKTRLLSGSIFLDYRSFSDLSYGNAILYGHQMDNGTMFEDVRKFAQKNYFDSHRAAYYTTLTDQYEIEFFAYLRVPNTSRAYTVSFQDKTERTEYLNYIKENSIRFYDTEFSENDVYFLLSTCTYEIKNGRGILIGRIVNRK